MLSINIIFLLHKIVIFSFFFTFIIASYRYGESNLELSSSDKKTKIMTMVFRFLVLGMVFVEAVASLPAIWNFADLSIRHKKAPLTIERGFLLA